MTKKEQAQKLYNDMLAASGDKREVVRKDFIARCVSNLGMTPAGASTYYSNCKTVAAGGEVKSYYTPSSEKKVDQHSDESKVDAPLWSVVVVNGEEKVDATHSFMSAAAATERWNKLKPAAQARCLVVEGSPKEGTPVSSLVKVVSV